MARLLSCGDIGFFLGLPITRPSTRQALLKQMKPSSWSPSKGNANCLDRLVGAVAAPNDADCLPSKFLCWW